MKYLENLWKNQSLDIYSTKSSVYYASDPTSAPSSPAAPGPGTQRCAAVVGRCMSSSCL